ncbi:hypothetical protein [Thermococcus sp.]
MFVITNSEEIPMRRIYIKLFVLLYALFSFSFLDISLSILRVFFMIGVIGVFIFSQMCSEKIIRKLKGLFAVLGIGYPAILVLLAYRFKHVIVPIHSIDVIAMAIFIYTSYWILIIDEQDGGQ